MRAPLISLASLARGAASTFLGGIWGVYEGFRTKELVLTTSYEARRTKY